MSATVDIRSLVFCIFNYRHSITFSILRQLLLLFCQLVQQVFVATPTRSHTQKKQQHVLISTGQREYCIA